VIRRTGSGSAWLLANPRGTMAGAMADAVKEKPQQKNEETIQRRGGSESAQEGGRERACSVDLGKWPSQEGCTHRLSS
jgi:hypothetical protein